MERSEWNNLKWKILIYLSIILIIVGIGLLTFYYFENKVNECTRDPLKYSLEKIESMYPGEIVWILVNVAGRQFSFERGLEDNKEIIYDSQTNNYSNFKI